MLESGGVEPSEVDGVFLTGGSSFVPSLRNIFASRFGRERIVGGSELTSVAKGLVLRSRDLSNLNVNLGPNDSVRIGRAVSD